MAGGFPLRLVWAFAALVVVALPVASADMTTSKDFKLDSRDVTGVEAAKAAGSVGVKGGDTDVDHTRCRLDSGTDGARDTCKSAVQAKAPTADVDASYGITVPLNLLRGEASAAPPAESALIQSAPGLRLTEGNAIYLATGAAAVAGLAAFLAVLGRLARLGLLGLLPLYSHIADVDLLKEANRARIFDLIKAEPGISTKDIADRLGLAWGTVTHHLAKLERRSFVVSKKFGKYRRYFANGAAADSARKETLAILKVPATAEVAGVIRDRPGASQKEVSEVLGVSSSTILWHVKRLERVSLVEKIRDGKSVRYYPAATLKAEWQPVRDLAGHV